MKKVNRIRVLTATVLLLTLCAFQGAPAEAAKRASKTRVCPNANSEPGDATEGQLAYSAVCLVNNERAKRGMTRLKINPKLSSAALKHNIDMVEKRYFEHVDQRGRDVFDRILGTGYLRKTANWLVGENLAWGTADLSTPRHIVRSWMRSPGHRANILKRRYREIGVGVTFGAPATRGRKAATYTQVFAVRTPRK